MLDYCTTVSNYFEPECIKAWYYVVDNDMILAWFLVFGQWLWNQPVIILLGWNFLPFMAYLLGIYFLVLPDAMISVERAPYSESEYF